MAAAGHSLVTSKSYRPPVNQPSFTSSFSCYKSRLSAAAAAAGTAASPGSGTVRLRSQIG